MPSVPYTAPSGPGRFHTLNEPHADQRTGHGEQHDQSDVGEATKAARRPCPRVAQPRRDPDDGTRAEGRQSQAVGNRLTRPTEHGNDRPAAQRLPRQHGDRQGQCRDEHHRDRRQQSVRTFESQCARCVRAAASAHEAIAEERDGHDSDGEAQGQQGQGQERRPPWVVERGEGREDLGRVDADAQNARHAELGHGQDEDHQRRGHDARGREGHRDAPEHASWSRHHQGGLLEPPINPADGDLGGQHREGIQHQAEHQHGGGQAVGPRRDRVVSRDRRQQPAVAPQIRPRECHHIRRQEQGCGQRDPQQRLAGKRRPREQQTQGRANRGRQNGGADSEARGVDQKAPLSSVERECSRRAHEATSSRTRRVAARSSTTKRAAASPITTVRLERHPHISARPSGQRPRIPASLAVTSSTRWAAFVKSSVIGVNVSMAGMFLGPGTPACSGICTAAERASCSSTSRESR